MRALLAFAPMPLLLLAAPVRSAPPVERGCEASAAFVAYTLAEAGSRPLAFSTHQMVVEFGNAKWADPKGDGPAKHPPGDLAGLLNGRMPADAVSACPAVQSLLAAHGVAFDPAAATAATQLDGKRSYRATVVTVSVPVLSHDGKQAVLASSQVSGPLAGAGSVFYLQRDGAGHWTVVSRLPLWVS
jgi:hypothetical protein